MNSMTATSEGVIVSPVAERPGLEIKDHADVRDYQTMFSTPTNRLSPMSPWTSARTK
jgi:hypothetical protein